MNSVYLPSLCVTLVTILLISNHHPQDRSIMVDAKTDIGSIQRDLDELSPCVMKSIWSFAYEPSAPPTTIDELTKSCARHNEGFQCIKSIMPRVKDIILKRGVHSLLRARQKQYKKICTNLQSQAARQHLDAFNCIMSKRRAAYDEADRIIASKMQSLMHHRSDAALELRQLCCALVEFRQQLNSAHGTECLAHKTLLEEIMSNIVLSDIHIVCPDEDKLKEEICPKLQKIQFKQSEYNGTLSPAYTSLYLFVTLGEKI